MKKSIYLLFTLSIFYTTLLASNQAMLKLDTNGHTGMVRDIIVTKNKDIISAGDDKTVRIWNKNGVEKRKILGQIGSGSEGMIYAIALSNNEELLAVGGYLGSYTGTKDRDEESSHWIRIHNYKTGKLIKILKSHTNIINDLAFSADDRYLISGSADYSSKIWDLEDNFALVDTIKFHSKQVYATKIIKKYGRHFAITAAYDNKIALYDIKNREVVKNDESQNRLKYIATSDNAQGGNIAVSGYGREIRIYDYDLNLIKRIKPDTKSEGLAYSENGDYLVAGTEGNPNHNVHVYKTRDNYAKKITFSKHENATIAVDFLDNNTVVSAGGDNNEIYIWDINTGNVKKKIEGVGSRLWSVGISGNKIAWGSKWTKSRGKSAFQKSIDLENNKISDVEYQYDFNRISTNNGSYSLSHSKGGDYGYYDGVLDIKKDSEKKAKIVRNSTNGYQNRCYGWYNDLIIVGASGGHIKAYNKDGKEIASLIGHTGEVWSIALDGDRLVSGSDDQTMKIWDISSLRASDRDKVIYPMLNIFVSKDSEWVVWSQSGYFNSSVGGDKYVGYHINNGYYKEARYVGSDKYFDTLFRPDIITALWQTGSEKKAIAFASKTKKVKSVNIAKSLPPVVNLLSSSNIKTSKKAINIKFSI